MPSAERTRTRWALAAEAALVAAIVLAPALLGGALPSASFVVCALAGLALALAALDASAQGVRLAVPVLAGFPLLAALFAALQLIPLPPALLDRLSPEAAHLRDFALAPLGLSTRRPVSLDPPSTFAALGLSLAFAALLVAACRVGRSRRARRRLFAAVALVGAATALVGFGHLALGAHVLFGLFPFRYAQPPLVTPFGNPNHLAAFLILAGLLASGLAARAEGRARALWAIASAGCGAAVLLSLSVAGIAIYLLAQAAFLVLLSRARRQGGISGRWFASLAAALSGLAVALYLAAGEILDSLATADTLEKIGHSKIALWPMFAHAAAQFPFGMGRGAFALAFSRYQAGQPIFTFTHPENFALQLAAGFGIVPACVLGAVAIFGALRLWRPRPSPLELAAMVGVFGLVLHDLFDFALELPACAVALWCVLGALAADPEAPAKASPRQNGWAVLFAALPLLAVLPARHSAAEGEARVWAAAKRDPGSAAAIALAEIDRHPADHLLYEAAGWALTQPPLPPGEGRGEGKDAPAPDLPRGLAFFERALYLRPLDAQTHLFAARTLVKLGRTSQALGEYHRALDGELPEEPLLDEALRIARGPSGLADLVQQDPALALGVSRRLGATGRAADVLALEEQMLALAPLGDEPVELLLDDGRLRLRAKDAAGALARAQQVLSRQPSSVPAALLEADALSAQGQRGAAIDALDQRVRKQPATLELSFALARVLLEDGQPRRAREVLERSRPFVTESGRLSTLDAMVGDAYQREGRLERALESYQLAVRLSPRAAVLHYQEARLAEALARYDEAIAAVREGLAAEGPRGKAAAEAWIQRLGDEARQTEARRAAQRLLTPDAAKEHP